MKCHPDLQKFAKIPIQGFPVHKKFKLLNPKRPNIMTIADDKFYDMISHHLHEIWLDMTDDLHVLFLNSVSW